MSWFSSVHGLFSLPAGLSVVCLFTGLCLVEGGGGGADSLSVDVWGATSLSLSFRCFFVFLLCRRKPKLEVNENTRLLTQTI